MLISISAFLSCRKNWKLSCFWVIYDWPRRWFHSQRNNIPNCLVKSFLPPSIPTDVIQLQNCRNATKQRDIKYECLASYGYAESRSSKQKVNEKREVAMLRKLMRGKRFIPNVKNQSFLLALDNNQLDFDIYRVKENFEKKVLFVQRKI